MITGLFDLAVVILIAATLGILAKLLKQPILLAYIATGALIAYLGFLNFTGQETFHIFSNLGIMFLLFLVGLEINYTSLRLVGKTSLIVGLGQIIFTTIFGFIIAHFFGFELLPSLYIAVALTFSSTIIIVKLLSDKKDLNSLYGKISIGFLLVQDLVAILILVFLSGIESSQTIVWSNLIFTVIKGIVLFVAMLWLGRKALPFVFDRIARSQELLFLVSLMWVFAVAAIVGKIGFSIEIAGFLAGLALANSSENFQIASKIRPLRDFFILIFFVVLGSSIVFSDLSGITWPTIIFSLFVLVGNPLIVLILMGLMGYRKRTSFFAGITVAQISEFSLILAALGLKLGHITESVVALVTAVGIVTIAISSYMIIYNEKIFHYLSPLLSVFEKKNAKEKFLGKHDGKKSIVLVGCHRTGESIALSLPKESLLIVDFDPEVIERLKKKDFYCLLGDSSDEEIFEQINSNNAKLVISTSPDLEDNLALIENFRNLSKKPPKLILRAETENEAKILYEKGVDYVLLPHLTSGHYLGKALSKISNISASLLSLRERDQNLLNKLSKTN